jgi:hypothetical protein
MLVLLPHVTGDLISPLVGLGQLLQRHQTPQLTHRIRMRTHLQVKWLVVLVLVVIVIHIIGVVCSDEIVKRCKHRRNLGLNFHAILWWKLKDLKLPLKDLKLPLKDPKDPLDDIAS